MQVQHKKLLFLICIRIFYWQALATSPPRIMTLLSQNCRSLGNLSAVPSLCVLVRSYHVDVLFLCETLVSDSGVEDIIRVQLGLDFCFVVNSIGRSGGLAPLFQRNPFTCHLINYSQNFINVQVQQPKQQIWRLTGFYGFPEWDKQKDSWNLIRNLAANSSLLWLIFGDFNDLLSNNEKIGLVNHPSWLFRGFCETLIECNLHDLPMKGFHFLKCLAS